MLYCPMELIPVGQIFVDKLRALRYNQSDIFCFVNFVFTKGMILSVKIKTCALSPEIYGGVCVENKRFLYNRFRNFPKQ